MSRMSHFKDFVPQGTQPARTSSITACNRLPQGQLGTLNVFFSLCFQFWTHWFSSYGLSFLQGELIVSQGILGTQSVQIIGFGAHGDCIFERGQMWAQEMTLVGYVRAPSVHCYLRYLYYR
jgi:hypothetical protein